MYISGENQFGFHTPIYKNWYRIVGEKHSRDDPAFHFEGRPRMTRVHWMPSSSFFFFFKWCSGATPHPPPRPPPFPPCCASAVVSYAEAEGARILTERQGDLVLPRRFGVACRSRTVVARGQRADLRPALLYM